MRPGPGLVVMALAFISGARRGSTSSISSKTTTTTSSPPQPQILTTTPPTLFRTLPTSSSSLSYVTSTSSTTTAVTGLTITTTSAPPIQSTSIYEDFGFSGREFVREEEDDRWLKQKNPTNIFNIFFNRYFYNLHSSTPNYFAYTFPLPFHLKNYYGDPRARAETKSVLHSAKQSRRGNRKFRSRRKRNTHPASINFKRSGAVRDKANENPNDSGDTLTTVLDSSSDQTTLDRGLPVHFPSLTAVDSSRSLDEDDIFALVAEDDLLSEESFDHLVKLTNDKIGDTNEEDYSSGTETVVESSSGSTRGASDNAHETPDQQNAIEHFQQTHSPKQPEKDQQQVRKQDENLQLQDSGAEVKEELNEYHDSEQHVEATYNAHLVGSSKEEVVLLTKADLTHSVHTVPAEKERRQATTTTSSTYSKAELDSTSKYHTILGSNFALTRLNPWISACDLAQPGPISAPDLQGECSAGTLPVAWVDEGPGPPTCLKSCQDEKPFTNKLNKDNMNNNLINNNSNNKNKNKNKNDNKLNKLVGYTTTTNTFNIKLRNSQPTTSHSINTNDNSNNNNNNNNIDNNNNKNYNIIQKLLNPFGYYKINNSNNNNMAKTRRNLKESSAAISDNSDVNIKSVTMNIKQRIQQKDFQSPTLLLPSAGDYELLMQHDDAAISREQTDRHEDQFNGVAITAAAIAMQLNQQEQQQNHINNNIIKMKLTATNYSENNSDRNKPNNQFESKNNHVMKDQLDNNNNNNRRYRSNNINNSKQRSDTLSGITTMITNEITINNLNNDQYLKIPPPEKEQQQCLEYLGDSDKTMPTHLCDLLGPIERLAQLRYLRLRNCCERNVYSALHTLALNVTLSGGAGCLRVLHDLMDLDALASRITCGLTEILFRFDCRQVYSIIHQCDDCKEAYRRWVCSTLVPYFAETSDVMKPPDILTTTIKSTSADTFSSSSNVNNTSHPHKLHNHPLNNNNNTTMASNMTTSHTTTATVPKNINHPKNNNTTDMPSIMPLKTVTSNFITNRNRNKRGTQHDANNNDQQNFHMQQVPQEQAQQEHHRIKGRNVQKSNFEQKVINRHNIERSKTSSNNLNDFHFKTPSNQNKDHMPLQQQQQQPQSLNTIPTSKATTFYDIFVNTAQTHESTNKRRKRSENSSITATKYADIAVNGPSSISSAPSMFRHEQRQEGKQTLDFISPANNEAFFSVHNPITTKLLKRSIRNEFEFRKRRRIRPCLSVCQTVEQKCPYLLPADRAPSMPTQYAGEPTFLCLDYDVAETEEQLKKATHGPNDCCYTYCSNTADGICTYCESMWDKTDIDAEIEVLKEVRERKVFNITMKTKGSRAESAAIIRVEAKIQQKIAEEKNGLQMSTVAIAVRNDTAFDNATRLAERLKYYAFCDGIFYYDDVADDLPEYPNSASCRQLPPVQSRCSIPYYATNYISSADMLGSYRKHKEARKLLIWLSTLLCLWSCYSARPVKLKRYNVDKTQIQVGQQQQPQTQLNNLTNTAFKWENMCQKCETREIMQNGSKCKEKVIKSWYDYRESRALIIYLLKIDNAWRENLEPQKYQRAQYLLNKRLRKLLHSSSLILNFKTFQISILISLFNYRAILLLIFKKRQKLRRRKVKIYPPAKITLVPLGEIILPIIRHLSFSNLISQPITYSFNIRRIHYYNYYYSSCSQIFSCSCNTEINKMNYYNYYSIIKRFKYKLKKFNFKNDTHNNKHNNNKAIMKISYKNVSIIKFNITKEATHIFIIIIIINSYNNCIQNCYNIITVIIISSNITNNSNNNNKNEQILSSYNLYATVIHHDHHKHHHQHQHHSYYNYDYSDYYKFKLMPNNMINNNIVLLKASTFTFTLTLRLLTASSLTLTISITLYNLLETNLISKIIFMIIMMILKMLIIIKILIRPLWFEPLMKKKYNKTHHNKNIKFYFTYSPYINYNSKKPNHSYFYYYNFNVNDWWQRRRWCRRKRRIVTHLLAGSTNSYCYNGKHLLLSGRKCQQKFIPIILL